VPVAKGEPVALLNIEATSHRNPPPSEGACHHRRRIKHIAVTQATQFKFA
jgi:hypothetical protein